MLTAAVRSLRIATFHCRPEPRHGAGAPRSHTGLCEMIYWSDSDRPHAEVPGVRGPQLFSDRDTCQTGSPVPFNLFLIKSIIEAHERVFKRHRVHPAGIILSVKVLLGQQQNWWHRSWKELKIQCDTMQRYSTEPSDSVWSYDSNCFCLGCFLWGKLTILAWEQIKLFHIHELFHHLIFSLHNPSWLNNCDWTHLQYRNSLLLPTALNTESRRSVWIL